MFDLGNLAAIGISLILLLGYRILDKDNRSLEKVKKYTDRLKEELGSYADKRSEDLKTYAIDLEIHQKAAKEVLRRVQVSEETLASKADYMTGMASRISEYDKALFELKEMSTRVDENLSVIQSQNAFVDGVGKILKSARLETEKLSSEIPAIRQKISEDSLNMMKTLKQSFSVDLENSMSSAKEEIQELEKKITDGQNWFAESNKEAVKTISDRFASINEILENAFIRAKDKGEKLEDAAFQKLKEQIDARGNKLGEAIDERFNTLRDQAKEKVQETQGLIKSLKSDWRKDADMVLSQIRAEAEESSRQILLRIEDAEEKVQKAENIYNERYAIIESKANEAALAVQQKIREQLKLYQEESSQKQSVIKTGIKEGLAEIKMEGETAAKALSNVLADSKLKLDEAVSEQEQKLSELNSKLAEAMQKTGENLQAMDSSFTERSMDLENRIMEGFETRSAELRDFVEQKLSRLESVRLDAERMESVLRESMAGVERRVEEDFALFGKDLNARQAIFEADFKTESARVKAGVKELEDDLNALKSKAYSDVSAQLKVFEDEFFSDLDVRKKDADERFAQWRSNMDERLSSNIREAELARAESEKAWSEEVRAKLAETQNRVFEQLGKLTAQMDSHREAISDRVAEADDALSILKAGVQSNLDDARAAADAYINAELERWKHANTEKIRNSERQAEENAKVFLEAAKISQKGFEDAKTNLLSSLGKWQKEFETEIRNSEEDKRTRLASFDDALKSDMAVIVNDWEKERKKLIDNAKQEREVLARDVRTLSDDVARLRQELVQKSAQALDDFSRSYDVLVQDSARKAKDNMALMDSSIEEFKRESRSLKDSFEMNKSQMAASLEEERKARERAFQEMDKEIKNFQLQTRLFEKSDELRAELAESLEIMKDDLSRAESRRAEMAELETQYSRIKRAEDELSQKITRFLAEKKRLDTMEDDYKRLISLSQSVDQKLAAVTEHHDQLTEMQAELRRLSEIAGEASDKYERVEKKTVILDATATAIDKNFQAISDIEKTIHSVDGELRELPDQVISLKRSLEEISAWKPKLDTTIYRLAELDNSLSESEKRVTELQKAREWLARAETRFEELNKKTQDHLRLLNDILKDEPSKSKKDKGAPPLSIQETVRKLAHQGWKVDEIAKAVKLSRGEVELILELGGQA